jgi:catechol 2,3-dioxygenase
MRLGHVGLPANDPATLADFYTSYLGLHQVARVSTDETGEMVLLSGRPQEEPQELALLSNPEARHVAFQVDSLGELRDLAARAPERGARVLFAFDHGTTISLYVLDPEGNACELYWKTGAPPSRTNRPVDLSQPEAQLLAAIGGDRGP